LQEAFLADNEGAMGVGIVPAAEVLRRVPCVKGEGLRGAVSETEAKDIDVHGLLQGFYKGARQGGVEFTFNSKLVQAERSDGVWCLQLESGEALHARSVVNAAGAWAQELGRLCGAVET